MNGGTLRDAFDGWNKERARPAGTVHEYKRAVDMFIQLHGDLPVASIKKSHARLYREALQEVPQRRTGALLKASLPELAAWGRKDPEVPKVSPGTINKQLGAVQAVAVWGSANGVIPEDAAWSDPFAKMRVPGEQPERTSFENADLKLLFAAPVFTRHEYPAGGRGPAAFWLPLLALFTGARQAELAGLTGADVQDEPETATPLLYITSQASRGKRLKTKASQRIIPIHAQLVRLGFLGYVEAVRNQQGDKALSLPACCASSGARGTIGVVEVVRTIPARSGRRRHREGLSLLSSRLQGRITARQSGPRNTRRSHGARSGFHGERRLHPHLSERR